MDTSAPLTSLRPAGILLLVTAVLFMIGASAAAYFRRFPLPTDPLERLNLIANDRVGWTAQAIIFPACFLSVTLVFGWLAAQLPGGWPRGLAITATAASAAALLLWLPITVNRLHLGAQAAELIRNYDPAAPFPVHITANTFWPYTFCALGGIALMAAALALAGALPVLGWIVAGLAVLGTLIGALIWHDWPPFMSYVILLVMAIGVIRSA